ncbi:hypothetical protein Tco_0522356 [Tanacetum coccineum]
MATSSSSSMANTATDNLGVMNSSQVIPVDSNKLSQSDCCQVVAQFWCVMEDYHSCWEKSYGLFQWKVCVKDLENIFETKEWDYVLA